MGMETTLRARSRGRAARALTGALALLLAAAPGRAQAELGSDAAAPVFAALRGLGQLAARALVGVQRGVEGGIARAAAEASAREGGASPPAIDLAAITIQGGIDREVVAGALRRQGALADVRRCVAAQPPARRPASIELRWFDGGQGIPRGVGVEIGGGEGAGDGLRRCVARAAEGWRLPQPRCTAVIRVRLTIRPHAWGSPVRSRSRAAADRRRLGRGRLDR
ncbi:MAG: hypothetical protein R3A79_13935 [Nannocystaceae bacterium]